MSALRLQHGEGLPTTRGRERGADIPVRRKGVGVSSWE